MAGVSPKDVEKNLKGVDYPAQKDDLVKHAKKQGASDEIIDALEQMPNETYNKPTDVAKAIGQIDREP